MTDEALALPDQTEEDDSLEEQADGSVLVKDNTKNKQKLGTGRSEHFTNLVEVLDEDELRSIATSLIDLIDKDKETQSKRDKLYQSGLQETGLDGAAPGGADFPGASRATHPLILEAAIDSAAQLYKELCPADGSCRTKIVGDKPDDKTLDRAERIKTFINWQMTDEVQEYEEELDQCLSQVPLAGSQFMKFWWDLELDRWTCEYIPQDKFWLPFSEQSFYSAKRKTHGFNLDQDEYDRRVESEMYADLPYAAPSSPDMTRAEKEIAKIQGEEPNTTELDQDLELYESYVWLMVESDDETEGKLAPYIVTIRKQDDTIINFRRNWEEEDESRQAMDWVFEFPYIRWRGSLTLGLMSVIGGLNKAATGALRALLDSAFVNNSPSLIKMKGARFTGQTQQVSPVGINEVEASPGTKDIRQLLMAFPYNPPSAVLFELLGFLVTAGKGTVSTAEEKIADASNQMPMGTALALIEQGGKVFSSIHKRNHKAMKRVLAAIYRLNRMYLTKEKVIKELGELTVKPEDFLGPCPIVPVSDPNIYSDAQRFAQMNVVKQLAVASPQLYNQRNVEEDLLHLAKVRDPDRYLVPDKQPKDLNPVAENMQMALGQMPTVFPLQNHLAHIQSHCQFYQDPAFGQNPAILPQFVGSFVNHLREHIVQVYAKMVYDAASAAAGEPVEKLMNDTPDNRSATDELLATVGVHVEKQAVKVLEKVLPLLTKAVQQAEQFKMPAPMDPTAVSAEAVKVEAQRAQNEQQNNVVSLQQKREKDQQDAALKANKQQTDAAEAEAKRQSEERKLAMQQSEETKRQELRATVDQTIAENQQRVEREKIAANVQNNQADNETALNIAAARAIEGHVGGLENGNSVTNPESRP